MLIAMALATGVAAQSPQAQVREAQNPTVAQVPTQDQPPMSMETCKEMMVKLQTQTMTIDLQVVDEALDELFATMRAEARIDRFDKRVAAVNELVALRERMRERMDMRRQMTGYLEGIMQTGSSQDASAMGCPMMKRMKTIEQD